MQLAVGQADGLPGQKLGEEGPDGVRRGRTARQEVIDLHHLVEGMDLVEQQGQLGGVGHAGIMDADAADVGLRQAIRQGEGITHGGDAAGDGAGAHRHQHLAVVAELPQHRDILGIGDAALDQAQIAGADVLDVGEGAAIEVDQLHQGEDALVDVEQGHVTAEAPRQGGGGDPDLGAHGVVLPSLAATSPTVSMAARS